MDPNQSGSGMPVGGDQPAVPQTPTDQPAPEPVMPEPVMPEPQTGEQPAQPAVGEDQGVGGGTPAM